MSKEGMAVVARRIRERRELLGLSQSELGGRVGYTSRSAVSKLEKNLNSLTPDKLLEIARVLKTTPGYLMGFTDDPYDYDEDSEHRFDVMSVEEYEVLERMCGGNRRDMWAAHMSRSAAPSSASESRLIKEIGDLSEEDRLDVLNYIAFVKSKRKP